MKHVNLVYVNLAFVVIGVIVIGYTFSVTFLSSAEIQDQSIDIRTLPFSPAQSPENPAGVSPESSVIRRSSGSQPGQTRAPAEVRDSSSRTPASRTPASRTPSGRIPSNVQRLEGTSRLPNVTAGRPTAGRSTSGTSRSRPGSPSVRQPAQPGSGFVVTPSQGVDREKRSAPQRTPSSPPVRGSLNR